MILMETIQRRELETCRILREKEEYERILRAKLTSDEYKLLMSSRSFTTEIHLEQPMLTSRSNDGENEIDSPVPVPLFELSSIYKTMPLAGGELEEKKSCGEDLSPHQLLKRNRGASVSLNIRREQLFPSTPHPISNSHLTAKSRHKSNHATNGRIVALLGGSRISSS